MSIKIKTKYLHVSLIIIKAFDSNWHLGLFYKVPQSVVKGKHFPYFTSCIKIGHKRSFVSQERGVRQGCCSSPALFNTYPPPRNGTQPHASQLRGQIPTIRRWFIPVKSEKRWTSTEFEHNWMLLSDLGRRNTHKKTKTMMLEKRSRCQGNKYHFAIETHTIENCLGYNYLGLKK